MHARQATVASLALLATLALAACGSTWVDADPSGCSEKQIKEMTADGPHGMAEMMGIAACKAHGMDKFSGKWRCHENSLQAACR